MSVKTALITGAAQGIGKAIAVNLAQKGFQLALADLPQQADKAQSVIKEIQAARPKTKAPIFLPVDVSDRQSVFDAVDKAADHFGSFDVMVNNAGIAMVAKVLECTPEELDRIMKINVGGVLYGTQAATKKFVQLNRGGDYTPSTVKTAKRELTGKIINCCSIVGNGAFAALPLYSASKFAVKGLTQASAKELAPLGITVNAYAPGIVLTPMWDLIDSKLAEITGLPTGENLKRAIDGIALKRGETPEDVAGLVGFLASEGSDYITGQNIAVDGGISYN
ncbi:KLTH0G17094p [Lachancea thermotolerans CBS 6340]|uniref:KLTH0G17094p n=1 Tax=Lachancea thermotolerans (strain ATCC 56472 / CBS 6340 / NRRL Y-8284) TaxID=559295 RepID=C5DNH6_LACTC|nr:KLTH0G17094p [Lachancea thermotolerans CBS 6340]CAR25337.1 KLTH0G17094p [Lachancea thermotolerans CBS 6340]